MSLRAFINHLNHRDTRLLPRFPKFNKTLFTFVVVIASAFVLHQAFAAENLEDYQKITSSSRETWLKGASSDTVFDWIGKLAGTFVFQDGKIKFWTYNSGVIGATTKAVAYLYTPPASGKEYIASVWHNFLGTKSAYAATGTNGIGFNGLQPLLPIWKNFRDAVYTLSAIIFILIGIMIMLRIKVSPQAVITIQSAVPQLIITLLLVTFSYAIAGLLIDASYVFQGLAITVIDPNISGLSSFFTPIVSAINTIANALAAIPFVGSFFGTLSNLASVAPTIQNVTNPSLLMTEAAIGVPAVVVMLFVTTIAGILMAVFGIFGGASIVGIAYCIVLLVFIIMIAIWIIQFLFGLFKCYANLIFKIVIAPLEIGMGAFPNSKIGFSTWIWDVISNLAVFPVSFTFLYLSNTIVVTTLLGGSWQSLINALSSGSLDVGLWAPSILGGTGISGLLAIGAISLSTLMLLPKLPEMIPQFIFMIKPSPWGQAIGQGMNSPMAFGQAALSGFDQFNKTRKGYYEAETNRAKLKTISTKTDGSVSGGDDKPSPSGTTDAPTV